MLSEKKIMALLATAVLAGTLALAGCGGTQAASSSAASSSAAAPAASASASASASAAATKSASAAASTAAAPSASTAAAPSASAAAAPSASAASSTPTSSYIGDDAAVTAALSHAGVSEADVVGLKVELDLDDAVVHYDIEFKVGNMEYDYDIDATTGAVLSHHSEIDD